MEKYVAVLIVCVLLALALLYEHVTFRTLVEQQVEQLTAVRCYDLIYRKQLNSSIPFRIAS